MKILIIGGNGTIGKKVTSYFSDNNEIIIAGRTSGDLTVDISDSDSIQSMFDKTGMAGRHIETRSRARRTGPRPLPPDNPRSRRP